MALLLRAPDGAQADGGVMGCKTRSQTLIPPLFPNAGR